MFFLCVDGLVVPRFRFIYSFVEGLTSWTTTFKLLEKTQDTSQTRLSNRCYENEKQTTSALWGYQVCLWRVGGKLVSLYKTSEQSEKDQNQNILW